MKNNVLINIILHNNDIESEILMDIEMIKYSILLCMKLFKIHEMFTGRQLAYLI